MDNITIKLTVFFENPFWIGVFEKSICEKINVCKVVFGAEPKDYQILEFVLKNYYKLKYSPEIKSEKVAKQRVNPKRTQREVKKQVENIGIGTKSQQALKLQQEQNKVQRKMKSKEEKELQKEILYSLKQQKRKEKHKGR